MNKIDDSMFFCYKDRSDLMIRMVDLASVLFVKGFVVRVYRYRFWTSLISVGGLGKGGHPRGYRDRFHRNID